MSRNGSPRPQLAFLAHSGKRIPRSPVQRQIARVLSTENKQYVKEQTIIAARWTVVAFVAFGLAGFAVYSWRSELVERSHPSPSEWSYLTRSAWRSAWMIVGEGEDQMGQLKWGVLEKHWLICLSRLEDEATDGRDVVKISAGGASAYDTVVGVGPCALDVTRKSAAWIAGYTEAVLNAGVAAEHLQDMVFDWRQDRHFPKSTVIGPSNPSPRRLPEGVNPPREEDCTPAAPDPALLYNRIAHGVGFSPKQRIQAMQAHSNWLEFIGDLKGAAEQIDYSIAVAMSAQPGEPRPLTTTEIASDMSPTKFIAADIASATPNLVDTMIAKANLLSRTARTSEALPLFLSALGAVRHATANPKPSAVQGSVSTASPSASSAQWMANIFRADEYPLPLRTGNEPLAELPELALKCKEAELMTYLGEIVFATPAGSKERGLDWTRSAVELSENTIRDIAAMSFDVKRAGVEGEKERERSTGMSRADRERCRECLVTGIVNWEDMLRSMAAGQEGAAERPGGSWVSWFKGVPSSPASSSSTPESRSKQIVREQARLEGLKQELIRDRLVDEWSFIGR